MNIHEYQGKELLAAYGVAIPKSKVAHTPEEAEQVAKNLHLERYVVKAQVHAGGRGKAGGIQFADTPEEVKAHAAKLIGKQLVTPQTGPEGKRIEAVLVEEPNEIAQEYYLSLVLDRESSSVVVIASSEGGVNIEEVAEKTPGLIHRETIDPLIGMAPFQAKRLAFNLGLEGKEVNEFSKVVTQIYELFMDKDSSMIEVNPLVRTIDQHIIALDAKFNFDENALYRQPEIQKLEAAEDKESVESVAGNYGLSYIPLDGNIGCLVNGAGLAMATMDIIKYYGGEPANFLDVGGSATAEVVEKAFEIILEDTKVEGIFINIFGGIMHCDTIAEGVVSAFKTVGVDVPVVIRLDGTNVEEGRRILEKSDIDIINVTSLEEGAQRIVAELES